MLETTDSVDYGLHALINNIIGLFYYRQNKLKLAHDTLLASQADYHRASSFYGCVFVHIHLAMIAIAQADLHHAQTQLDEARSLITRYFPDDTLLINRVGVFQAEIHYERNEIAQAESLLNDEVLSEIAKAEGWPELYLSAYIVKAGICFETQGLDAAEQILNTGRDLVKRYPRLVYSMNCFSLSLLLRHQSAVTNQELISAFDLAADCNLGQHRKLSWLEEEEGVLINVRRSLSLGLTYKNQLTHYYYLSKLCKLLKVMEMMRHDK